MLFFVELDYVRSGPPLTPEAGLAFIERFILPTLARAEQLVSFGDRRSQVQAVQERLRNSS